MDVVRISNVVNDVLARHKLFLVMCVGIRVVSAIRFRVRGVIVIVPVMMLTSMRLMD
jgi:hypothetical protein